jgi:transcriptional regulator with XRE-family HTH domain
MNLGDYIAKRRQELGLSQRKLGVLINKSSTYINHLEANKHSNASEDTLSVIAHVLCVRVDTLLALAGKVPERVKNEWIQEVLNEKRG